MYLLIYSAQSKNKNQHIKREKREISQWKHCDGKGERVNGPILSRCSAVNSKHPSLSASSHFFRGARAIAAKETKSPSAFALLCYRTTVKINARSLAEFIRLASIFLIRSSFFLRCYPTWRDATRRITPRPGTPRYSERRNLVLLRASEKLKVLASFFSLRAFIKPTEPKKLHDLQNVILSNSKTTDLSLSLSLFASFSAVSPFLGARLFVLARPLPTPSCP